MCYHILIQMWSFHSFGSKTDTKLITKPPTIKLHSFDRELRQSLLSLEEEEEERNRCLSHNQASTTFCEKDVDYTPFKRISIAKNVWPLPFSLSLAIFANGVCWTADAVTRSDLIYLILSGMGAVFGALQLIIYVIYYILVYAPDRDSLVCYIGRFARIIWQELMGLCGWFFAGKRKMNILIAGLYVGAIMFNLMNPSCDHKLKTVSVNNFCGCLFYFLCLIVFSLGLTIKMGKDISAHGIWRDIDGLNKIPLFWRLCFQNADGLIYVVDGVLLLIKNMLLQRINCAA
ncbi:uncharacterized protein LOC143892701 isoform X2 [Tasmannia lanceolata]|uniref:uncharacterized protein LOC143892701 isoform X2 n=1 Tax=Tasmannia lanceolata TaxID=3420 RepID=UPI004063C15E